MESGGILHRSRPRHYMEVSGQFHAPTALPPGKQSATNWIRGWLGAQSRSGRCEVEKNLLPLQGIELQFSSP
jgi:hypothetical protein